MDPGASADSQRLAGAWAAAAGADSYLVVVDCRNPGGLNSRLGDIWGRLRWTLRVGAAVGRGDYRLGGVVVACGELRADLTSLGGAEAGVEGEGLVQVLAG
jgi:hypothetical protein